MEDALTPAEAYQEAIRRAGTQAALAMITGTSQPTVSKRLRAGAGATPAEAIAIERALGLPRHLLCPAIFGDLVLASAPAPVACERPAASHRQQSAAA